jgi:hypothetical protein
MARENSLFIAFWWPFPEEALKAAPQEIFRAFSGELFASLLTFLT